MNKLALTLFFALLYLPALGASESGSHPDESYYLGISADMDARGAWLTPTLDGKPLWFKPPLLYWGERVCYRLLGRDFLAARLPAALATIALVLLTYALGRRMYGGQSGLIAALLTGTTFGLIKFGRMAMMDAPMALSLAVAAYGTWRAVEEERPPFLLLAGVGAGAATLLKGPVGAVLVLLLAGGYLALRSPRLLATRWTAGAFALGAAIALPWYLLSYAVHGQAFYDFFVVQQNYDRFRHSWTWSGEVTLLAGFLIFLAPWTFLILSGLRGRWREPGMLLPLVWMASVLLTFTIPSLKWPHYGITCIPAAALLASRTAPPRWSRAATAALLAVLGVAALCTLRWPLGAPARWGMVLSALFLGVSAVLAARGRLVSCAVAAGGAAALTLVWVVPSVNPPVLPRDFSTAVVDRTLYVYDAIPGVFTMAAGRTVHRITSPEEVEQALASGGALVLSRSQLESYPGVLSGRTVTLARWRRIPGYLPPKIVWRSWLEGDTSPIFEEMLLVGAH